MSDETERSAAVLPYLTGRDHAALALMPITLAMRDPAKATAAVSFEYTLSVGDRRHRVAVTLAPAEGGQLPVHEDQMVYLALLQLALSTEEPEAELRFTRYQVFDLLKWPNSGPYYQKLQGALDRLAELTVKVDTAVLARDGRQYSKQHRVSHLIDTAEIGSGRDALCRVEWGGLVREAFKLHDFKSLDWDLILALDNPLTAQLYRLIDRVTLAGHTRWEVTWHDLAAALGMSVAKGTKPARVRQRLEPHFQRLIEQQIIDGVDYQRGGVFVIHVRNYLRAQIRRVIEQHGVFPAAATELLTAHEEADIMAQVDCLLHGSRARPQSPGGYLTQAIREGYELQYGREEPEAFAAIWEMLSEVERKLFHRAGIKLCGVGESLFETHPDPTAWRIEMRSVVRFMITQNLDPAEILRTPAALGPSLPGGEPLV